MEDIGLRHQIRRWRRRLWNRRLSDLAIRLKHVDGRSRTRWKKRHRRNRPYLAGRQIVGLPSLGGLDQRDPARDRSTPSIPDPRIAGHFTVIGGTVDQMSEVLNRYRFRSTRLGVRHRNSVITIGEGAGLLGCPRDLLILLQSDELAGGAQFRDFVRRNRNLADDVTLEDKRVAVRPH